MANIEVIDPAFERKQKLNSLLGSAGFVTLSDELKELSEANQADIEQLQKSHVDQGRLAYLNYLLGKKKAFEIIFEVFDSYREELEER